MKANRTSRLPCSALWTLNLSWTKKLFNIVSKKSKMKTEYCCFSKDPKVQGGKSLKQFIFRHWGESSNTTDKETKSLHKVLVRLNKNSMTSQIYLHLSRYDINEDQARIAESNTKHAFPIEKSAGTKEASFLPLNPPETECLPSKRPQKQQ